MTSSEQSMDANSTDYQQQFAAKPWSVDIFFPLLQKLGVSVEKGLVATACAKAETIGEPLKKVAAIFNQLQLQNVKSAIVNWNRFDPRQLPAMVFHQECWKLLEKGKEDHFLLTDETGVVRHIAGDELASCAILWIKVFTADKRREALDFKRNAAVTLIWKELNSHPRWLRDVAVATLVINLIAISTSMFAMQVYDRVVPTLAYATLWTLVAGMFVAMSIDWTLKVIRARVLDSISAEVSDTVSQKVYDHIINLRLDSRPRSLGTMAAQVGGLDSVKQFFSSAIIFALVDLPFALLFIAFIGLIGGPVAFVYMTLLPIALCLGLLGQNRLKRVMKLQIIRSNERQGLLVDTIQGTETIRASHAGWRFSEQWKNITTSITDYNIQQKVINNFITVSTSTLSTCAYVSAIVVGVHEIAAGNLTTGALVACSILGGRVISPISQSVQYLIQWQNVVQSLNMVSQLLELDTERDPGQNLLMPDEKPDRVLLEDVQFSYPGSPVKQLDLPLLELKAGDRVLLAGAIGSGKTTLLKVLAGLYRPVHGRIRLGNADLWETDPGIVSGVVGYLPQSVHLFKGTLHSNLTLSGIAGDSHLLQVCKDLGIDQIAADNPLHMSLEISEGGDGLSGGQRQLVGLGRLFMSEPTIWLLDEPTSSLDSDGSQRVFDVIEKYVKPDDILVISTHRLGQASRIANRMIMMEKGRVMHDGKPDDVMAKVMRNRSTSPMIRSSIPGRAQAPSVIKVPKNDF